MAGVVNDYLIFPILELIRKEMSRNQSLQIETNPFEGEPDVQLYRDHPIDPERVTGARMEYESGYVVNVYLTFGTNNLDTLPTGVDPSHLEWEYYTKWRLTKVGVQAIDTQNNPIANSLIRLNYDKSGRLTGTTVDRI